MAYFQLEPFGATDQNAHMAMLIAALINRQRGEKEDPVEPKDFMLGKTQDEVDEEESAELIAANIRAWAAGMKR